MKDILLSWAIFTVMNLSVQEICRIFIFTVISDHAAAALAVREHAIVLQAMIAGIGAAAACLPFLQQIRWETGFPGAAADFLSRPPFIKRSAQDPSGRPVRRLTPEERSLCYILLLLAGALASGISVCLITGKAPAGAGFFRNSWPQKEETLWGLQDAARLSLWDLGCISILYSVLTPVIEELFFRGLLLGRMRRLAGLSGTAANILSSFLFALYHGAPAAALYAFPLGLLLGRTAMKTRSVMPPILLHGLVNFVMLQLSFRGGMQVLLTPFMLAFFLAVTFIMLYITERY